MDSIIYRENQLSCIEACMDYINNSSKKAVVCVEPTAFGKSWVISEVANRISAPVLVLQPKVELLNQNYSKLIKLGGTATIYSASKNTKELSDLTYATLGSLKKDVRLLKAQYPDLVVLVDECHSNYSEAVGSEFKKFLAILKPKKMIGFTATPFRSITSARGPQINFISRVKGAIFKDVIHITSIQEMIDNNWWTPIKYKTSPFDESLLIKNKSHTDFTEESIISAIEQQGIHLTIIEQIRKMLDYGLTSILVFADSVDRCKWYVEQIKNITNASCVHDKLTIKERDLRIKDFQNGEITVMFNYGILSVGFDKPDLQALIMGRATNSITLWYQIVGRIVRKDPSKEEAYCIDFCGNVKRLGKVEHITIENYPNWGWAAFSKDKLLTNTPLQMKPVYKKDLKGGHLTKKTGIRYNFGKYKGKDLAFIPKYYIEWSLTKDTSPLHNSYNRELKQKIKEYYEKYF